MDLAQIIHVILTGLAALIAALAHFRNKRLDSGKPLEALRSDFEENKKHQQKLNGEIAAKLLTENSKLASLKEKDKDILAEIDKRLALHEAHDEISHTKLTTCQAILSERLDNEINNCSHNVSKLEQRVEREIINISNLLEKLDQKVDDLK